VTGTLVRFNGWEEWDLAELKELVLESRARRRLVDRAHSLGLTPTWDYNSGGLAGAQYFRPSAGNPSASNYNNAFEVRARPDSEIPNRRSYP